MRIVSLLPSATEIICELGLRDCLVGVSHECDYPSSVRALPAVTESRIPTNASSAEIDALVREQTRAGASLYSLCKEALTSLRPDLIATQALCDVCAVAEEDVRRVAESLPNDPSIVNLEPMSLAGVFHSIELLGRATGVEHKAAHVVEQLRSRVNQVRACSECLPAFKRTVFLEWLDPPFCAGHWTPELIQIAGGIECIGSGSGKSETTNWRQISEANPEVLIIACCGFDVPKTLNELSTTRQLRDFKDLRCAKNGEVYVIDGNAFFNRPGPRLVDGLEILANALHPNEHQLPPYLSPAVKVVD